MSPAIAARNRRLSAEWDQERLARHAAQAGGRKTPPSEQHTTPQTFGHLLVAARQRAATSMDEPVASSSTEALAAQILAAGARARGEMAATFTPSRTASRKLPTAPPGDPKTIAGQIAAASRKARCE